MQIRRVHAVYFSGTGTTEKTVRRIARRLADKLGAAYAEYSYTLPDARKRELTVPAGDLAVVGCPTYAGRVPNVLLPYLTGKVRGSGTPAVPVVLFGSLGGTLGMFCFHHKTKHWYFRYGFPILLVVQLLLLGAGAYLLLR